MRFMWTLCIATLVPSDASAASTKTNSTAKILNENLPAHHLQVEPEERGSVREILKALGALPEEIAVVEKAMPSSATEAKNLASDEKSILSDKEAESIRHNLWMEFEKKFPLPDHHSSASSRDMIFSKFMKFVAEDPGTQGRYKQLLNWHKTKYGRNEALPDTIAAVKPAMTHATKEDAKPDFNENTPLEMWIKFKQQHQLQELLDSTHLESTTQQKIKDEFLKFVANDARYMEWLNRRNSKADWNKAGLVQEIPAVSPAMVHATAETEITFSKIEAEKAMQKMWNKFQLNYVPKRQHVQTFNDLKPESRKKLMPLFLKFVSLDLDRKRMLDGWMKWQSQTGKYADWAREIRDSLAHPAKAKPMKKRKRKVTG